MDCSSAHRLRCCSRPLRPVALELSLRLHLAEKRAEAEAIGFSLERLSEPGRCRARQGDGRCHRPISEGAATQYCSKHQGVSTLANDRMLERALEGLEPQPGDRFEGEEDAEFRYHGAGVLDRRDASWRFAYAGNFCRGRFHGMGRFETRSDDCEDYYVYVGESFYGKAEGRGQLSFPNSGLSYTGEFSSDVPCGHGVWGRDLGGFRRLGQFERGSFPLGGVLAAQVTDAWQFEVHLHDLRDIGDCFTGFGVVTDDEGSTKAGAWRKGLPLPSGLQSPPSSSSEDE